MDKQAVLEKIKKCLALSKSANEHEAAQGDETGAGTDEKV